MEAGLKRGDKISINVGGYADKFAGKPVQLDGELEYFDKYGRYDKCAVILFGNNNRVILTPTLHQVTTPGIFSSLNIKMEDMDIISLKSGSTSEGAFTKTVWPEPLSRLMPRAWDRLILQA